MGVLAWGKHQRPGWPACCLITPKRRYLGTLFSLVMLLLGGVGYGALASTCRQVQDMFGSKVQVLESA